MSDTDTTAVAAPVQHSPYEHLEHADVEIDEGTQTSPAQPSSPTRPPAESGGLGAALLNDGDGKAPEGMEMMTADDEAADDGELGERKSAPDTTLSRAAFHIFKGNVGVGIFLLPMVYNDTGYILSPLVAVPVGCMIVDNMLMLLHTKTKIARNKVQTYPEVGEFIFGSLMRIVVNVAVVIVQLSFCLIYYQTAAGIFADIVKFDGNYKLFVFLEFLVVVPLTFLSNNMSLLAISSAVATVLVWYTAATTFIYAIIQLHDDGVAPSTTPAGTPIKWSLFLASNMSVLEGINIVLPVENAVVKKDKPKLAKMLRNVMSGIVALYLVYAITGYLAYGCDLHASAVEVLPKSIHGDIIRCGLATNLLLTYPLQFVPAIQIIDRAMGVKKAQVSKSKKAVAARIGISLMLMMVAMLLGEDALSLVVAFSGATAAVFLAVILPSMMHLHVDHAIEHDGPRQGKEYFKAMLRVKGDDLLTRLKCFAYIVIGILIFVIGTVTCLIDTTNLAMRKKHGSGSRDANSTAAICN